MKLFLFFISINWPRLVTYRVVVQKIYSKLHPVSCTDIHHDVTDLVNHGMLKNTKTRISWEWNITFQQNKKTVSLCLKWHILRNYCFVLELTFKMHCFAKIKLFFQNVLSYIFGDIVLCIAWDIIRTLSIINSEIFRHIHILHIQSYFGIFKTLCNSCFFRTLSYSESWHI